MLNSSQLNRFQLSPKHKRLQLSKHLIQTTLLRLLLKHMPTYQVPLVMFANCLKKQLQIIPNWLPWQSWLQVISLQNDNIHQLLHVCRLRRIIKRTKKCHWHLHGEQGQHNCRREKNVTRWQMHHPKPFFGLGLIIFSTWNSICGLAIFPLVWTYNLTFSVTFINIIKKRVRRWCILLLL